MDFLNSLLSSDKLKRAAVGGITAAVISGNHKFGLGLDATDIIALTSLAVAFIGQSALKEVKMAGIDAAAKVDSVKTAIDVMNAVPSSQTVNVDAKP